MKKQFIFLVLFVCFTIQMQSQSAIVIGGGVSMGYTDNPATSGKGKMLSGFHGSLTGRIGRKNWYIRPGIEVHKMKLLPEALLNPFSNEPSMYLLKIPAQVGVRLLKSDNFNLRVAGGFQFSYTISIQKNNNDFTNRTIKDTQVGALIGGGIDLGFMAIDVNFEKGLSELYKGTGYKADYIFVTAGFLF